MIWYFALSSCRVSKRKKMRLLYLLKKRHTAAAVVSRVRTGTVVCCHSCRPDISCHCWRLGSTHERTHRSSRAVRTSPQVATLKRHLLQATRTRAVHRRLLSPADPKSQPAWGCRTDRLVRNEELASDADPRS